MGRIQLDEYAQAERPEIPVLIAVAICTWPGASAEQIEQLITKPIEETIGQNYYLHEPDAGNEFAIVSTTLADYAIVQIQLSEGLEDTTEQFNDINLRLDQLNNQLPEGAGPYSAFFVLDLKIVKWEGDLE